MADAVCHGDTKGVEVSGDILYAVKPVWCARYCAGDLDTAILQSPLQDLHHILIFRLQVQHPGVQLLL